MTTINSGTQTNHGTVWWQGSLFKIKGTVAKTGGVIGLSEADFYGGFATPLHVHHREDEAWYVLDGELRIRLGDEDLVAKPGDFVFGPRDVPHSFKALDGGARALILTAPGGFEEMFLEGGLPVSDPAHPPPKQFDIERVQVLAQKYGFEVIGPPIP
jgi:mannose-6-phosphate isomerase-like protein (cupin superfamily)